MKQNFFLPIITGVFALLFAAAPSEGPDPRHDGAQPHRGGPPAAAPGEQRRFQEGQIGNVAPWRAGRPGMRLGRMMMTLRRRAKELKREESSLQEARATLEEEGQATDASPDAEQRREWVRLRSRLLEIEKERYVEEASATIGRALEKIDAHVAEHGPPGGFAGRLLERVREHLRTLQANSGSFEELTRHMHDRSLPLRLAAGPGRIRDLEREIDLLERRLERLREEVERLRELEGTPQEAGKDGPPPWRERWTEQREKRRKHGPREDPPGREENSTPPQDKQDIP